MRDLTWKRALAVLGAAWMASLLVAGGAAAQSGGCTATIDGVDVRDGRSAKTPIRVDAEATIVVSGQAPGPIDGYGVNLVFGPFSVQAASGTVTGGETSYTTTVNVADYARFGVGLYRVEGWTTGTVCEEWTYVEVTGRSPLTTVAGIFGALAAVGGLAGMATAAIGAGVRGAGR